MTLNATEYSHVPISCIDSHLFSHPHHRKVKDMIDQGLIINHPEKLIKSQMENKSGACFGKMFDTHDPNMVLKRGRNPQDGWILWAMFSIVRQYDWMPKIHILNVNIDYKKDSCEFWALMEKLEHPEGIYDNWDLVTGYWLNDERKIQPRYGEKTDPTNSEPTPC